MSGYRYPFFVFLLSTVLIDSVTKSWFWQARPDLFVGNYFNLIYFEAHQNTGIMLGIAAQLNPTTRLLIGVMLVGIILVSLLSILLYKGFTSHTTCLAWGLLLGGGISNLIERMKSGSVSDFILIDLGSFQSGIFNLADVANLAGLFILIGYIIIKNKVR
ncbi:MAG: signal peptidase II [Gammaproteobacteria bacterium]|nr:signal peptidase II [Gammaproteobacteria bacterium]